jgi:hypothetical protein
MCSIGPQAIKNINRTLDYVEKTLRYQYVIPHYGSGWATDVHNDIANLKSFFKCSIELRNVAYTGSKDDACDGALPDMASLIVDDYCVSDVDCYISYDCDEVKTRKQNFAADLCFQNGLHTFSITKSRNQR